MEGRHSRNIDSMVKRKTVKERERETERERHEGRERERKKERKKNEVELNFHLKNIKCADSGWPGERRYWYLYWYGILRGGNCI
jgi:hypothetical protein